MEALEKETFESAEGFVAKLNQAFPKYLQEVQKEAIFQYLQQIDLTTAEDTTWLSYNDKTDSLELSSSANDSGFKSEIPLEIAEFVIEEIKSIAKASWVDYDRMRSNNLTQKISNGVSEALMPSESKFDQFKEGTLGGFFAGNLAEAFYTEVVEDSGNSFFRVLDPYKFDKTAYDVVCFCPKLNRVVNIKDMLSNADAMEVAYQYLNSAEAGDIKLYAAPAGSLNQPFEHNAQVIPFKKAV